ncbi:hypothetical protein LCGC14_0845720 [marine sediment metagenome]|uniref:Uncharacterized protein n=1 Tax=marine sediment metagenome TaxID=412755 RepID=A0A0F9RWJ3_9ZZZZ
MVVMKKCRNILKRIIRWIEVKRGLRCKACGYKGGRHSEWCSVYGLWGTNVLLTMERKLILGKLIKRPW